MSGGKWISISLTDEDYAVVANKAGMAGMGTDAYIKKSVVDHEVLGLKTIVPSCAEDSQHVHGRSSAGRTPYARISRKAALVSGSYDPFTNGHLEIVRQAAEMFSFVHVVIFTNSAKKRHYDKNSMVETIRNTLATEGLSNCTVGCDDGLLAKYCMKNGIEYNVRGLRDNFDYDYEEKMVAFNKLVYPAMKTVYLRGAGNKLSSSDVRELIMYNEDITPYVPPAVADLIMKP